MLNDLDLFFKRQLKKSLLGSFYVFFSGLWLPGNEKKKQPSVTMQPIRLRLCQELTVNNISISNLVIPQELNTTRPTVSRLWQNLKKQDPHKHKAQLWWQSSGLKQRSVEMCKVAATMTSPFNLQLTRALSVFYISFFFHHPPDMSSFSKKPSEVRCEFPAEQF